MENNKYLEEQNKIIYSNEDFQKEKENFQNLLDEENNIEEGEFENNENYLNDNNENNNNINEEKTEKLIQQNNLNLINFKENEQRAFYIDTIIVSSHVSYIIKGKNISQEISLERRYREFDALHNVLLKKWPGIYIPPIPKKQIIKNTDSKTIEKRKNVLDNFLKEVEKQIYIMESEEIKIFLDPDIKDVSNILLSKLEKIKYKELNENYKKYFIKDYENNPEKIEFDENQLLYCKEYIDRFILKINNYKYKIKELYYLKTNYLENSEELFKEYVSFENKSVSQFYDKNKENLLFADENNLNLKNLMDNYSFQIINPYKILNEWCIQKELNLIGLKESLKSYVKLKNLKPNIEIEVNELNNKLSQLNKGKKSFFEMVKMKSTNELIEKTQKKREQLKQDLIDLENIVKILKNYYSIEVYKFFTDLKISLYEMIKIFAQIQLNNSIKNSDIWLKIKC
jgi:hypothetical protein